MKRSIWIILIILLLAVISRPNIEDHQNKINLKFKGENPIPGALGGGKVFSNLVEYHDYYLFSYTSFRDETVSIGAFKLVIVLKDLEIGIEAEAE